MLAIDLCCGLGGWARGLMAAGFEVIGFDIEPRPTYPGTMVVQDVRTIDGRRFRGVDLIVASPPCTEFSRLDIPQTRKTANPNPDMSIVEACCRIAGEALAPFVMENVRGAKKFIPGCRARWGSCYLWGDVPLLVPETKIGNGKKYGWKTPLERAVVPFDMAKWVGDYYASR